MQLFALESTRGQDIPEGIEVEYMFQTEGGKFLFVVDTKGDVHIRRGKDWLRAEKVARLETALGAVGALEAQIDELERRIAELEGRRPEPTVPAPEPSDAALELPALPVKRKAKLPETEPSAP